MTEAPRYRLSKYCLITSLAISSSTSTQSLSISFVKYFCLFIIPVSHKWAGMSNKIIFFKIIYMIVYIPLYRKYIFNWVIHLYPNMEYHVHHSLNLKPQESPESLDQPSFLQLLLLRPWVYYTESGQFIAHAQERIPRKGGTTCSARKGAERRLPTTQRAISCMPSIYKYSKGMGVCQIGAGIV
jgi:hypothetical protein